MPRLVGYRTRERALTLGLLLVAPAVLAAVHYLLPPALQAGMGYGPGDDGLYAAFASALVHADAGHLRANLLGYALVVGTAYPLAVAAGERRWFWLSYLGVHVAAPVAGAAATRATLGPGPTTRGFSGVVAGLGGLLLVALAAYVRRHADGPTGTVLGTAAGLSLAVQVAGVYAGSLPPTESALVGLVWVLAGVVAVRGWHARAGGFDLARFVRVLLVVAWVLAVLAVFVASLFPADPLSGDAPVNVFAHAGGFLAGVGVAAWGFRYWQRPPGPDAQR